MVVGGFGGRRPILRYIFVEDSYLEPYNLSYSEMCGGGGGGGVGLLGKTTFSKSYICCGFIY